MQEAKYIIIIHLIGFAMENTRAIHTDFPLRPAFKLCQLIVLPYCGVIL